MRSSLAIAALVILTASAIPALAEGNLIAHWPMDEVAEGVTVDASGNGHDASFFTKGQETPVFTEGMVGKAVRLIGESQQGFNVPFTDDLNFKGAFTVMAWVKPTRRNAAFEIACMKGDKSGEPPWPGWRLRYFWARVMLQVGTPEGEEPGVGTAEWTVPAEFWSHVATSWDGKKLRAYVNGALKAEANFEGQIAPQPKWRSLVLGNYIGRKDAYAFDGWLDDIRVYGEALDEDAVFQAASSGM